MKKQRDGNTADFHNGDKSANSLVTSSVQTGNVPVNPSELTDNKSPDFWEQGRGNNGETEQDRGNVGGSGEIDRPGEQGQILVGSLLCGAVPALVVGFGAMLYHTGYQQGAKEARPTIIHGNQHNTKIYNISPSIGSNNSNNSHNQ